MISSQVNSAMLSAILHLCAVLCISNAAKILLVPNDHASHVMFFSIIGDALIENGHEVVLFSHVRHKKLMNKYKVRFIYQETSEPHFSESKEFKQATDNQFSKDSAVSPVSLVYKFTTRIAGWCEQLASDTELMERMAGEKFDLAIMDGFVMSRCTYFIPYKLNVKHMTFSAMPDPWNARVPTFASVEPFQVLPITNEMSFINRLSNLGVFVAMSTVFPYIIGYDDIITKYIPERPPKTLMQLYQESEMFLINLDNIITDYPRVSAPHYQFIGGMGSIPAKPLPKELEEFVSGAEDGIIVVSFGSLIKEMPVEMLQRLLKGFEKLPRLRAVMRFAGKPSIKVPSNVKLLGWLPQNDLLGHNKTRAFITHGGNNGQLESLYQGVPQIVMPIFGDQLYNSKRTELHKYGVAMNIFEFTSDELVLRINEVVYEGPYAENIKRASEIIHSLPSPIDRTTFWVEHILKFGGSHLRPSFMDMPLYKFVMLDIIIFLMVVLHLLIFIVYKIINCICCRRKKSQKQKSE